MIPQSIFLQIYVLQQNDLWAYGIDFWFVS